MLLTPTGMDSNGQFRIATSSDWMLSTNLFSAAARSIVTGIGATGFQISSTRDSFVTYSTTITTTATIGVASSGTIALEYASTNSATAGDWVEIGRITSGQTISLAALLQSVLAASGCISGMIPAGYYAKLRSINNSGTPTYALNSGQEVLL